MGHLFGGTDTRAFRGQQQANTRIQDFARQQGGQSRSDLLRLFPQASEAAAGGYDSALSVLRNALSQRAGILNTANAQAQQAILGTAAPVFDRAVDPAQVSGSLDQEVQRGLSGSPTQDVSGTQQAPLDIQSVLLNARRYAELENQR